MNKKLICILVMFCTIATAQKFEKGYFIDNAGNKTECYIKNLDWKNNPNSFKYKIQLIDNEISEKTISEVKEFEIDLASKFVRETVKIDQSSNNDQNLTNYLEPNFKELTVFLKILVVGKSNLYYYEDSFTERYFFSIEKRIEQLVYKRYSNESGTFANETFKRQLFTNFMCKKNESKISKLEYTDNSIINYFIETNECLTGVVNNKEFLSKSRKFEKNLKINVLTNFQNVAFQIPNVNFIEEYNFGSKTNLGFGFEGEIILPYNNQNWSIIFDPSISFYKNDFTNTVTNTSVKIKSSIFRLPIGIRRNFKIKNENKIFINTAFTFNFSGAKFETSKNLNGIYFGGRASYGLNFGLGYEFKKFSTELKYYTKTPISGSQIASNEFNLNMIALKFGYRILN